MSKVLELRRYDLERKKKYTRKCDNCGSLVQYTEDDYFYLPLYYSVVETAAAKRVSCPVCCKTHRWDDIVSGGPDVQFLL